MLSRKIIIGVSGGPDSIYLLNEVNNKNRYVAIAVHVNYHFRDESNEEQKFVEDFCKDRGIKLYVVDVTKDDLEKYSYLGNKQSMARQLRYDKYFEFAKQEGTEHVFVAHHRDDFIETAIMQESKSNDYLYFGIQQNTKINGFEITRPLLNKWKDEIIDSLNEQRLEYKIDKSNFEPVYERNKIRLDLQSKTKEEKESIYNRYQEINSSKEELRNEVNKQYDELVKSEFDWDVFNNINNDVKRYVVYKWLIEQENRINISSDKLEGIIEFLSNKRGDKAFRLMEKVFMSVKNSKIIIYNN